MHFNPFSQIFVPALFVILFSSFHALAEPSQPVLPNTILGYQERVGDKVIPFSWKAENKPSGVVISVFEDNKSFYNLCKEDGSTIEWRLREEGKHNIQVIRDGNSLHISGLRSGEKYDKTVEIDRRPWYQPLSFSLGKFLNSSSQQTSFWVVRADNIEVIALTAEKIGEEQIVIDKQNVLTQKIEIRAEGFFSKFWSATYWYRKSDNLFLRYQSVHGLPGTDETIVELVSPPDDWLDT